MRLTKSGIMDDGERLRAAQIVEETKEVIIPNDPIVDGFKFDCWLYNGQKVNEPIIADADKDIVASF